MRTLRLQTDNILGHTATVKQSWFKPRVCQGQRMVSGVRPLARLQEEVTQIRGLKVISRKEKDKDKIREGMCFALQNQQFQPRRCPTMCFT